MTREQLLVRFTNTVIGARVGDAMGTPTEGMTAEEIVRTFGWVDEFVGDGTDDSLMADILARTLIETQGAARTDDWAERLLREQPAIKEKADKFFASVLHLVEKLRYGSLPSQVAKGNMPSSSSAMCIWPVGLVHSGNPAAAAHHATELASLIHTDDVDYCIDGAAAIAAAVASAVVPGATVRDVLRAAIAGPRRLSGERMRSRVTAAIDLAIAVESYDEFRDRFHSEFTRPIICDSSETVPAALGLCALAGGDLKRVVEFGANFGRDTDTIASMSGAICGALSTDVPHRWRDSLGAEAMSTAGSLAGELLETATIRHHAEVASSRAAAGLFSTHA